MTSRQPKSIVSEWPRPFISTISVTPGFLACSLWLLPSSWGNWATLFEEAGFAPIFAAWPDDPLTVEEAADDPAAFADKTIAQVRG